MELRPANDCVSLCSCKRRHIPCVGFVDVLEVVKGGRTAAYIGDSKTMHISSGSTLLPRGYIYIYPLARVCLFAINTSLDARQSCASSSSSTIWYVALSIL